MATAAVRIPSTDLKKSVKAARKLTKQAIDEGRVAVREAKSAAKREKTKKSKRTVARLERKLAKAIDIDARLKKSERLANDMCPLQVMFLAFKFV